MKLKAAQTIVEFNPGALRLRESYSGRFMYGEKTSGVVGNLTDIFESIGEIMQSGDDEDREIVGDALRDIRLDNMALEYIIY